MKMKNKLKNSFLFPVLVYLRYWIIRYIINREFISHKLERGSKIKPVDSDITFFGYYNISPENENDEILFLKVGQEKVRGSLFEPANIMLKKSDGSISKIAETKAWNWQQGCMLQWLSSNNEQILFNDYDEERDKYISRVIDKDGRQLKTFNIPVNNVSKCGKYALSLNYDRLAKMRPDYGYFNKTNSNLPPDNQDGIWHLDLTNEEYRLVISLKHLREISYSETMNGAIHKVNHIDISPSSNRFMFLHRWVGSKGRFMRLITANPDGSNLQIMNGDIMTSHCCWIDSKYILSYCEYKGQRGYFKFLDQSTEVDFFSKKMPSVDGHPSVSPDEKWLITDTYPDKARMSYLYLHNIEKDEIHTLGRFHQPLRYKKEIRIDLHPKWSVDGSSVFFESGHSNFRKLYRMSINKNLNQ